MYLSARARLARSAAAPPPPPPISFFVAIARKARRQSDSDDTDDRQTNRRESVSCIVFRSFVVALNDVIFASSVRTIAIASGDTGDFTKAFYNAVIGDIDRS